MKRLIVLIVSLATFMLSTFALAQSITLYDQPSTTAKAVGKVDLSSGIIPIFKPSPGDWVKVADPHNGNVGWVKSSDMQNVNEARTYQIIQYGKKNKMTDEQIEAMVKKMRYQEETMQKAFQNMFNNMNKVFQDEWNRLEADGMFPIVIPIVINPSQKSNGAHQKAPATVTTTPTTAPANQAAPAKKQ